MFFSKKGSFFFKSSAILLLFVSLCIPTSCTKSEDSDNSNPIVQPPAPVQQGIYTIGLVYAYCYTWLNHNKYKLSFNLYVQSDNKTEGNITAWTFRVKKGTALVMEINNTNFASLGFVSSGNSHIFIDYMAGNGKIIIKQNDWQAKDLSCDKLELTVTVVDAYGKTTTWVSERAVEPLLFQ